MVNTLPAAATGGALTCSPPLEPWPTPRRQAIERFGAASTFSTDCSAVPPGSGHSAITAGLGR